MKKYLIAICLLFVLINVSFAQQPVYSARIFKPVHEYGKMDSQRGAIYEEWQVRGDGQLLGRSYKIKGNVTLILDADLRCFVI